MKTSSQLSRATASRAVAERVPSSSCESSISCGGARGQNPEKDIYTGDLLNVNIFVFKELTQRACAGIAMDRVIRSWQRMTEA